MSADLDGVYDADRRERWEFDQGAADRALLQAIIELDGSAGADNPARDGLCARWIDDAHRFGAVAVAFPGSLRCQRFAASFWAPEVFFWFSISPNFRESWYLSGGTREGLDVVLSPLVHMAPAAGTMKWRQGWPVDTGKPRFWSPELPEVRDFNGQICVWTAAAPAGWLVLLLLLFLALPASAQTIFPPGGTDGPTLFGVVSQVTDGDTLIVGEARIRLYGIDAPEGRQECREANRRVYHCGNRARAALTRLVPPGSSISCRVKDTDRYGRLVAVCSVAQRAGSDLGREMVAAGWAVAYRKYSTAYVADEDAARSARCGLWAGSFQRPEEWRRAH